MKCLVTGASGFIGSHLVKALEARGDEVYKVSHFDLSYSAPIITTNIFSIDPDYIFHLAAYGNMANQKDWGETFNANLEKTYILLMASKDIPYKAFINVSSSSVLLPHETMYSATKAGAERLCKAFADEYDKPIVTIRPYSVYGPGEADFRFIPTCFRSCLSGEPMEIDPDPVHDWIYVDDLVNIMLETAEHKADTRYKTFNVGTGVSNSNLAVLSLIEEITGKQANVTIKKGLRSFDNEEWLSDTKYTNTINLRQGLEKYYHWYLGRL